MNWYSHSVLLSGRGQGSVYNIIPFVKLASKWYKKVSLAAFQSKVEDGIIWVRIVGYLSPDEFKTTLNTLKGTGLQTVQDAEGKWWARETVEQVNLIALSTILGPAAMQNMGLGQQQAVTPEAPQAIEPQQQQPQQQQPAIDLSSIASWILAKTTGLEGAPPGKPAAVGFKNDKSGFIVMNRAGDPFPVSNDQVTQTVSKITDENGNSIQSADPAELFVIFDEMQQKEQVPEKSLSKERPKPEDVRLPDKFMSVYNKAIEQKFLEGVDPDGTPEDIMINALAGTGKSTQLKHLSSFIEPGQRWLYLVFNKKNQLEASAEFPEGVDVATTHSFLGNVLKQSDPESGGKTKLPPMEEKGTKLSRILDQLVPRDTGRGRDRRHNSIYRQFRWSAVSRIKKIAELAKSFAVNPNDPEFTQKLVDIIGKYSIDMDLSTERQSQDRDYTPEMLEHVKELLLYSLPGALPKEFDKKDANTRDQDDTLWYAAINADQINWGALGYDVVLMDEVQDFNQCQLVMAQKLKEAGARVIGVGDPNQAIYGWRGADAEAFEKLQEIVTEDRSPAMELPINFRSLPAIIDFVNQNTHVKNLEAAPQEFWDAKGIDPNSGQVNIDVDTDAFIRQLPQEYTQNNRQLAQETAIISRTNAPLVEHALGMLRNDIDFQILGRNLSRELIDHINKVTWYKPTRKTLPELDRDLANHLDELQDEWGDKVSKQEELKSIEQTTEALQGVLNHVIDPAFIQRERRQIKTANDFIGYIEEKLSGQDPDNAADYAKLKAKKQRNPRGFVTLTTAHKSKGMEWERVFILEPGSFDPSREQIKTEAEAQQERNLWYVGLTRARSNLIIGSDKKE